MHNTEPVTQHYARLLASRYVWMLGGVEQQRERNAALVDALDLSPKRGGRAADLGGGPGFFAIALARRGFEVDLVDTSPLLLERARDEAGDASLETHLEDLGVFLSRSEKRYEVMACLGDTLTHLSHLDEVVGVCENSYARLEEGGHFIVTYRDLSAPLEGLERFIPVRADDERSFVCFLERGHDQVRVHDLVYERNDDGTWEFHKSTYCKLIVPRDWLVQTLAAVGFTVGIDVLQSGMLRIVATKEASPAS